MLLPLTLEPLEPRLFLHNPVVLSVTADNRGEVLIRLDEEAAEIDPAGFNKQSVRMYSTGPDGVLNTVDDERIPASVRFRPDIQRIELRATSIEPGIGYRVRVVSSRIPVAPGSKLDGEFDGTFPSGDGVAGGDFEFQVKNDRSDTPRARMSTSEGPILMNLRADAAPFNVNDLLTDADAGKYDDTFFTRSVPGLVIQAGSLQIRDDQVVERLRQSYVNEVNLSNRRGTVAMSIMGFQVGSTDFPDPDPDVDPPGGGGGGSEFFFNLADNGAAPNYFDDLSGQFHAGYQGYTVIAEVTTEEGLAVMDAIAGKPRADLSGVIGPFSDTFVAEVPVQEGPQAPASLDPVNDLVVIRRLARVMRVVPL